MIRSWVVALALVAIAETASAAGLPAWARDLSRSTAPNAGTLVVVDEIDVVVTNDGKVRTTRRFAVGIRDRESRDAAAVRETYVTGSGKINLLRAWVVRANGEVREFGDRDIVDVALVNNDIYNEVRVKSIAAGDHIRAGDLFVGESQSEEALLFSQLEWTMQGRWPARATRRTLTLPAGWRATSVTFNSTPIEPRREGETFVWEAHEIAALPDEPGMPPTTGVAPRVAVSFFAPDLARTAGQFANWSDVSAWLFGLSDAASRGGASIAAKARELTANAVTDVDRVAAIARYAQGVRYISIQTGLGRGGGYQPRPAPLVLERNYGDCKDKASLMRALLAAIGIKSYLVTVYSGDRTYVRPEWPSPQQFNHAIVAVAIADTPPNVTSAIEHPTLGRLLLFDPTDEYTPFGELPQSEQGSLALVVSPAGGVLVQIPLAPAETQLTRRTIEGVVTTNGQLTATITERVAGSAAAAARARRALLSEADLLAATERRVSSAVSGAQVRRTHVEEDTASRAITVVTEFEARAFAQRQGPLMLFAAPLELGGRVEIPSANDRKTAVLIEPMRVDERVRLTLPAGMIVDEKPPPVSLDTPFGRYSLTYAVENGLLTAARSLDAPLQSITPEKLPAARTFFDQIRAADTALVVLVAK